MSTLVLAAALGGCEAMAPPLTGPEVASFSARIGAELARDITEAPIGPLDVDQAVARAVTVNQTVRAKALEVLLAEARARAAGAGMLPRMVAESSYYRRDRPQLSRSSQSTSYSTSSDLATLSREIALSWNILDFGLSYMRARQGVDRASQQQEEARRIKARIAEETRLAFWKAVALDMLEPGVAGLKADVSRAMQLAERASSDLDLDPSVAINLQRDILNLQRELNLLHASLAGAKHELRQLAGLQAVAVLRLEHRRRPARIRLAPGAPNDDIAVALRQRAEIRQHMYDLRITRDEVDVAVLQLLPSATFSRTLATDSNSFLLYQDWTSWGAKVAGNLMNLARLDSDLEAINRQGQVQRQAALATAATVVMQVHVARAKLEVARRSHGDAERFRDVQHSLERQVRAAVHAGKSAGQALAREQLATLLADVRAGLAYAELEAAEAAYLSARGEDAWNVWAAGTAVAANDGAQTWSTSVEVVQ